MSAGGAAVTSSGEGDSGRFISFEDTEPREPRRVLLSAGLLLALAFGAQMLFGVLWVVVLGVGLVVSGQELSVASLSSGPALLSVIVAAELAFLVVALRYTDATDLSLRRFAPSRGDVKWALAALGLGIAIVVGLGWIAVQLGLDVPFGTRVLGEDAAPWMYLAMAALSVVLIAPAEEAFFRGTLQRYLATGFSSTSSILLASVAFVGLHFEIFFEGVGVGLIGSMQIFTMSVLYGWVYAKTQNIATPILVHGGYNVFGFLLGYVHVVGI